MRSVVVVLPASMCAMMPMLRTLLRSVVMSTAMSVVTSLGGYVLVARGRVPDRAVGEHETVVSCSTGCLSPAARAARSPAVVGEGLVRLGHLVGVLALLHRGTEAVGGVEDLVHQPLGHRLLAAVLGVADEPAERQRRAAGALDLDRDLVRRATDAAGLDLDGRLDVVHRPLQRDDG